MSSPRFVHLRLHSEYSIADGIVRIDDAVAAATADGMPALALTDLSNVFGLVKFYQAARGAGVKPIIGCDVLISNERTATSRTVCCCCASPTRVICACASCSRAPIEEPVSRPSRDDASNGHASWTRMG